MAIGDSDSGSGIGSVDLTQIGFAYNVIYAVGNSRFFITYLGDGQIAIRVLSKGGDGYYLSSYDVIDSGITSSDNGDTGTWVNGSPSVVVRELPNYPGSIDIVITTSTMSRYSHNGDWEFDYHKLSHFYSSDGAGGFNKGYLSTYAATQEEPTTLNVNTHSNYLKYSNDSAYELEAYSGQVSVNEYSIKTGALVGTKDISWESGVQRISLSVGDHLIAAGTWIGSNAWNSGVVYSYVKNGDGSESSYRLAQGQLLTSVYAKNGFVYFSHTTTNADNSRSYFISRLDGSMALDASFGTDGAINVGSDSFSIFNITDEGIIFSSQLKGFDALGNEYTDLILESGSVGYLNDSSIILETPSGPYLSDGNIQTQMDLVEMNIQAVDISNDHIVLVSPVDASIGTDSYVHLGDYIDKVHVSGSGNTILTNGGEDMVTIGANGNYVSTGEGSDNVTYSAGEEWIDSDAWAVNADLVGAGVPTGVAVSVLGYLRHSSVLDGGAGFDQLILSAGNDLLALHDSVSKYPTPSDSTELSPEIYRINLVEKIDAGAGNDLIDMTSSIIDAGDIILLGGEGNDILWGGSGNDTINGGGGSDVINGGRGEDELWGGGDSDIFEFTSGSGNDTVKDFSGTEDSVRIYLRDGINEDSADSLPVYDYGSLTITLDESVISFNADWGALEIIWL